jgi:hypothetical protein
MQEQEQIKSRRRLDWPTVVLNFVLLLLMLSLCGWWGLPLIVGSKTIVIRVATDGLVRVHGVPLANRTLSKLAFSLLARSNAKVHLDWQSPLGERTMDLPMSKGGGTQAQLGLLHAMGRAGVTNLVFTANPK